MDRITEEVIGIFAEAMGVDSGELSRTTRILDDLNADSLDIVELTVKLEDRFGISILDEEAEKMRTLGDVIDYLSGPGEAGVLSKLIPPPRAPGESA